MKRNIVVAFLAFALCSLATAQQNRTEVEVRAGISRIAFTGKDFITGSLGSVGGHAGVGVQQFLNKTFSVHLGVLAERKGAAYQVTFTDATGLPTGSGAVRENLDYLTVPLLVQSDFGNNTRFYVQAGGYASYLMRARSVTNAIFRTDNNTDVSANYESMDFGWCAGAALNLPCPMETALPWGCVTPGASPISAACRWPITAPCKTTP